MIILHWFTARQPDGTAGPGAWLLFFAALAVFFLVLAWLIRPRG